MRIITISREFGSGGRELGKRLAEALQIPCYDDEIIEEIVKSYGYDKNFVTHMSEKDFRVLYPATISRRFAGLTYQMHAAAHLSLKFASAQQETIRALAEKGDCVVVGRCADVILNDLNPLKLFVYASRGAKLERCMGRMKEDEHYSEKEMLQMMKRVDKERAAYREVLTDQVWGRTESYHLCINTSGKEIKALIPGLAAYIKCWFGEPV